MSQYVVWSITLFKYVYHSARIHTCVRVYALLFSKRSTKDKLCSIILGHSRHVTQPLVQCTGSYKAGHRTLRPPHQAHTRNCLHFRTAIYHKRQNLTMFPFCPMLCNVVINKHFCPSFVIRNIPFSYSNLSQKAKFNNVSSILSDVV